MRAKYWKGLAIGVMTAVMLTGGAVCQAIADEPSAEEMTFEEAYQEDSQELPAEDAQIPEGEEILEDAAAEEFTEEIAAVEEGNTEEAAPSEGGSDALAELDEIGDELFDEFEEADVLGEDTTYRVTWKAGEGTFALDKIQALYEDNDYELKDENKTLTILAGSNEWIVVPADCFSTQPQGKMLFEWIDENEETWPVYDAEEGDDVFQPSGDMVFNAGWRDAVTVTWQAGDHGWLEDADENKTKTVTEIHPKDVPAHLGFPGHIPDDGYTFENWYLNGNAIDEYDWTYTGDNTITAGLVFTVRFCEEFENIIPAKMAAATAVGDSSSFVANLPAKLNGTLVYSFTPVYSGEHTFSSARSETAADPYVELFDSNGVFLADSDDVNDVDFALKYNYTAGKKYYLKVGNYSHSAGNITLTMSFPHTHSYAWAMTAAPTAIAEGVQSGTCTICGASGGTQPIAKLPAFITMNVAPNSTVPLKERQSTTKIQVTGLQTGDSIVSWTSSNTKVATVTNTGKITGRKKGTTVITVTSAAGATYTFKVKVQKNKVAAKKIVIESPKKITLKKKAKAKIGATLLPLTTLDKLTYSTSDKKIAKVKKGVITAMGKGKATITVKAGKKTIKIKVNVTK